MPSIFASQPAHDAAIHDQAEKTDIWPDMIPPGYNRKKENKQSCI